jgi:hypothetical protein
VSTSTYQNHPQVRWSVNGFEGGCYVYGPNVDEPMFVRIFDGSWRCTDADRGQDERFSTADEAISWALTQAGAA